MNVLRSPLRPKPRLGGLCDRWPDNSKLRSRVRIEIRRGSKDLLKEENIA